MSAELNPISPQAKGGNARAQKLSKERRGEIAKQAAEAKWGVNMLQADFEGDVKIAGRSIPAAVLPNGKRLLNQGQFLQAIGRARTPKAGTGGLALSADGLPFFLQAELLKPSINNELRESTTPILFRNRQGRRAIGYDAALLPKVCEVYLKFRNACAIEDWPVPKQYEHIVKACDTFATARLCRSIWKNSCAKNLPFGLRHFQMSSIKKFTGCADGNGAECR